MLISAWRVGPAGKANEATRADLAAGCIAGALTEEQFREPDSAAESSD